MMAATKRLGRPRKSRHWRQRFREDAEYVWRKRRRLGDGFTVLGDHVDKSALRPGLLKRLWAAGSIELSAWPPYEPVPLVVAATTKADAVIVATGRGWFDLSVRGRKSEKLRGSTSLRERCRELGVDPDVALRAGVKRLSVP